MKFISVYVTALACLLASASLANTITFETAAPFGDGFTGPITENGFTYSTLSGGLYVNGDGNPGQDLEGSELAGGGVLKIVATGGGDFTFDQLDYSAFGDPSKSQTLTVNGLFQGSVAFTDNYTLANTEDINFITGSYANWTTEVASALAGQTLDELDIVLAAGSFNSENIDNVALTLLAAPPAAPEPASLTLLGAGLAGLGFIRRRKRA